MFVKTLRVYSLELVNQVLHSHSKSDMIERCSIRPDQEFEIMGMKTNVKTRAEIRAASLMIGAKIISLQGYREFSVRKVAREIGYTVGSLYNVFTDQYDFLLQINANSLEKLYSNINEQLKIKEPSGIDRLRVIAYSYFEFASNNYNLWCLLFDSNVVSMDETPQWYTDIVNKLFVIVEDQIVLANYNIKNVRQSICTLWSGVHGICSLYLSGKLDSVWPDPPLRLIDDLIGTYTQGLINIEN